MVTNLADLCRLQASPTREWNVWPHIWSTFDTIHIWLGYWDTTRDTTMTYYDSMTVWLHGIYNQAICDKYLSLLNFLVDLPQKTCVKNGDLISGKWCFSRNWKHHISGYLQYDVTHGFHGKLLKMEVFHWANQSWMRDFPLSRLKKSEGTLFFNKPMRVTREVN